MTRRFQAVSLLMLGVVALFPILLLALLLVTSGLEGRFVRTGERPRPPE